MQQLASMLCSGWHTRLVIFSANTNMLHGYEVAVLSMTLKLAFPAMFTGCSAQTMSFSLPTLWSSRASCSPWALLLMMCGRCFQSSRPSWWPIPSLLHRSWRR